MPSSPGTTPTYQPPENGFRTFLIIWVTQSLSVIGSALTYFSITIWLTQVLYPHPDQKAQLALALSAVGLAWGIPHILTMPIAGAWADRHDRKTTMIVCDFFNALLSMVLVILIGAGVLQLWLLLLVLALSTVVSDFHGSAFDTSYAMLVPEKQLQRANGMMQTTWSLSGIFSPAIAAGLIALPSLARQGAFPASLNVLLSDLADGTVLAIGLDVLTFVVAAVVPLFLFIPSPKRPDLGQTGQGLRKTMWADIKEGAQFIWIRRPMLWLLVTFTVGNLMSAFQNVLRPMVLKFNVASNYEALGFTYETSLALISSAIGVGGLIGGLLISAWGGMKHHRVHAVVLFMLLVGLTQALFGFSPWLYISVGAAALWSGFIPFMNAHSQAIWQTQTPRELQGRVFAVRRVIAQFSFPLGTSIAGAIGGIFNPGTVVAVAGIVMAIFTFLQLFNRVLMRIEDQDYMDSLAAPSVVPISSAAEAD